MHNTFIGLPFVPELWNDTNAIKISSRSLSNRKIPCYVEDGVMKFFYTRDELEKDYIFVKCTGHICTIENVAVEDDAPIFYKVKDNRCSNRFFLIYYGTYRQICENKSKAERYDGRFFTLRKYCAPRVSILKRRV